MISPGTALKETLFKISRPPRRTAKFSTTKSGMEADPQAQRHGESERDESDIDDRQGGNEIDRPRAPEGDEQGADHLGSGTEQIYACRILAHENQENQQPGRQHAVSHQ